MTAMVSRQENTTSYNPSLDMDDVHTPASEYSTYSQNSIMSSSSGLFPFSQTGQTDLQGPVWDTSATDGARTFHDEDFSSYSYGHITPRGQSQDQQEAVGDMSKWIATEHTSAPAVAQPMMRRMSSHSSSSSRKHRTIKASKHKSRPRLLSTVSRSSHMSEFDMAGNAQMDTYLLPDSDAHSVSSQMFYPTLPMSVNLSADGIPYSPALLASGVSQQHIDPSHMQLNFDASLASNSPPASWGSFSPVESRISSPGLPEDASSWSIPMGASPSHTNDSSPLMNGVSPSLDRQMGLVGADDLAVVSGEDMFALPPTFSRRPSNDGESTARDHPLYKRASPQADGLFHCPWEGQAGCNHKAEKLKCNYDKFVDSHLKPYRCKVESCENAKFSSTACLLRHEREAHAMHGHGDKPYLCTYEGCDRASPGNGFPRQWNLRDHMRRVHNDNGSSLNLSTVSAAAGGSSPPPTSSASSIKGRKRKSKDMTETTGSRKAAARAAQAAEAAAAASQQQQQAAAVAAAAEQPMLEEWHAHREALMVYLQNYDSPDAVEPYGQLANLKGRFDAMGEITQKLFVSRRQFSG